MSVVSISDAAARAENDLLEMLRIDVKFWRKTSGLSFRYMPVDLWGRVLSAAQGLGAHRVAAAVGVNLEDLKQRLETRKAKAIEAAPAALADDDFCDLPGVAPPREPMLEAAVAAAENAPPLPSETPTAAAPTPLPCAGEACVEIVAADGAKLTVRLPVSSLNISALIHDFRSRA
jgi:hypothetical protein